MSLTSRILLLDVTENGPCGLVAESGMSALGQKRTSLTTALAQATPRMSLSLPHFAELSECECENSGADDRLTLF